MKKYKILYLLNSEAGLESIVINGWVRTKRDSSGFSFIEVNNGSCLKNIQIIADNKLSNYNEVKKLSIGSAMTVCGDLVESKGTGQRWEIQAKKIDIIGIASDSYPLQKKRHTDEYLRTIAHLRPRTNKYGAVFRIRSELSFAIHKFFRDKGFKYIHTPIITGSDCEGAGEMFKVTSIEPEKTIQSNGRFDYSQDFFGKPANLTVSGQLSAEMLALALGDVYTFGPTFRAENSNTRRHAAEFWMVEPEMVFCDINGDMDLGEQTIKFLIGYALQECKQDLELFGTFVDKELIKNLENIYSSDFIRLTYEEAVKILTKSKEKFEYEITFGKDLQAEHENYLAGRYFKKPVILYNYPKKIKPFYMRVNDDDKTVAAMDILVPGIGELIGGSQREERLDMLELRMDECGLFKENYWWYLDSRRFGTVPHSGFGLGFERLLMLVTGIKNIRDVIPFPRTPGNIEF